MSVLNDFEQFERSTADLFAQSGAAGASDELIALYLPRLRAFIRARMGGPMRDRESESDVLQSVCRGVLEGREGVAFDSEAQFRSWLFTAALNKIREKARYWGRDKRSPANEVADGVLEELQVAYSGVFTPSRVVAAREEILRLETALNTLTDEHGQVIAMARIARLPHDEIARRMGKTVGATRQMLGRALRALAAALGDAED